MNNKYICEERIKLISENPCQALHQLQKLRLMGQENLSSEQWTKAISMFGTAYEMATVLLFSTRLEDRVRSKLFLHTAIEYCFALRKSEVNVDMGSFVALVRNQISQLAADVDTRQYLSPVEDVAFLPITEVDYLMQLFFHRQGSKSHSIH